MLKTFLNLFISIIDYVAPQRMDALVIKNLNKENIFKLPKGPAVENMNWIHPLFHYKNNTVRAIIWELKYKENTAPLPIIGDILHEEIIALISDIILFNNDARFILIPIPISTERRIERGYNQSEFIAKSILPYDSEHILLYAPQWFQKIKDTQIQSKSASRQERLKNLAGCFSADSRVDGSYIILIDDVVTTGSTLSEARKTLLEAGARDVFAFTIAH